MHLHYDAQSDLIAVLAEQTAAGQVIYTTHSAASLPEDLGLGVRVVEGIEDQTASRVRQNFWRDDEPGLTALMMAMGASSLAFVALRPAVVVEGGSDLVLLPSLFREAIRADHVGFAIVPGAATAPADKLAGLDLQGTRTAWLFDADDGGRARRNELIKTGVPRERVLLLASDQDLEVEDLIAGEVYCAAVTSYARDVGITTQFSLSDLPSAPAVRHDVVVAWCNAQGGRPPGKIAIANKVVALSGDFPLLEAEHAEDLRALRSRLGVLFAA